MMAAFVAVAAGAATPRTAIPHRGAVELCSLDEVRLAGDGCLARAVRADVEYVRALDVDRLLAPFRREAGIRSSAHPYGHWESMGLDGHTLGHWLSAVSHLVASGNDADGELSRRLEYAVGELAKCQEKTGGRLDGIPGGGVVWDAVSRGDVGKVWERWAPWYNVHKTFAGLRDAWLEAGNVQAKATMTRLADWIVSTTANLDGAAMEKMLAQEFGGMNETFADLYAITGDEKYLAEAKRWEHHAVLDPLYRKEDALTGLHANTQIPKFAGLARTGQLAGDRARLGAADFAWRTIVERRSVAFGGNSVGEHFHALDDFGKMLESREGPETCNTYNMLRLTERLFECDPRAEYAEYYERALFNHVLSAVNTLHPGFVYFTPARAGHYRTYSTPQTTFWCCVGTGMECPGRFGRFIYARGKGSIYVNLFVPSELKGVLRQTTDFPSSGETTIEMLAPFDGDLMVREGASYVRHKGPWKRGDRVRASRPMERHVEMLPDGSGWGAYMDGPILLAQDRGAENMDGMFSDGSASSQTAAGPLLEPLDEPSSLVPFWTLHERRYQIYWKFGDGRAASNARRNDEAATDKEGRRCDVRNVKAVMRADGHVIIRGEVDGMPVVKDVRVDNPEPWTPENPKFYEFDFYGVNVRACLRTSEVNCGSAAFRMMTRAEAASGASVAVTGVVTMVFSSFTNSGLLADASDPNGDAVYFLAQGAPDAKLKPGDVVAVAGTVAPMAYSPGLIGTEIKKLGSVDLPPPPFMSYGAFSARCSENRRARLRGTLTAVKPLVYQDWETARDAVLLRVDTGDGMLDARVPGSVEEWCDLVDAELELAGVASVFFNARAQFVSMRLQVCEKDDITVLRAPPKDPFAIPCSDFEGILSYTPSAILPHAVHVIGEVTYADAKDGFFYVQNGGHGLKVVASDRSVPEFGSRVDVVGFPRLDGGIGRIVAGRFRLSSGDAVAAGEPIVGKAQRVMYYRWSDEHRIYQDNDGILVSVRGRFVSFSDSGFIMDDDGFLFEVRIAGGDAEFLDRADFTKPMLEVTGVASLTLNSSGAASLFPQPQALTVLVQNASSVRVLPDAAWRMRRAQLAAICSLKVVGALLVAFLLVLLVKFVRVSRARSRLAVVTSERKRMAADLHDTIEQHLACAHIMLDGAMRTIPARPDETKRAVRVAMDVLSRAKREVRKTIMDLRDDDVVSMGLDVLLRRLAAEVTVSGLVKTRTALRGIPKEMSVAAKLDIVAIVREALTNAAKHGHARNAAVASDPLPDGGFVLTVANDGEPFDRERAAGPAEGHYGLSGMEERAARIGGRLSFGRKDAWTTVRLEVRA